MRRLRLAALVLVLAASAAGLAAADNPDPFPPDISSTHKYDAEKGTAEFCITVNSERWAGKVFDVEFAGHWAPGLNAPENKFSAPKGWTWGPNESGGWRAKSTTPMRKGPPPYCFVLPVTPPLDKAINLTATDENHHPIHNFLSTEAVPQPAPGAVKTRFTLGARPDAADGIFGAAESTCTPPPNSFSGTYVFTTDSRSRLTIRNVALRNGVSGRIARNGVFHLRARNQAYDGAIQGRFADAEYRRVVGGCTERYSAQFQLDRAGRVVRVNPCRTPRIRAPRSARVRGNTVRFAASLVCGGELLASKTIDVWVHTPDGRLHVGKFKTDRVPIHMRLTLGNTHPTRIELIFRRSGRLRGTRWFIAVRY